MRHKKSFGQGDDVTDINISPLIDMVFILLIFFIVTTVFVEEKGIASQTPDPVPPIDDKDEDEDKLSLLIKKTGQVIALFGKTETDIGLGGVSGRVQQEKNRTNDDELSLLVNVGFIIGSLCSSTRSVYPRGRQIDYHEGGRRIILRPPTRTFKFKEIK